MCFLSESQTFFVFSICKGCFCLLPFMQPLAQHSGPTGLPLPHHFLACSHVAKPEYPRALCWVRRLMKWTPNAFFWSCHAPCPHCHLVHCHLPSLNSVHKRLAVTSHRQGAYSVPWLLMWITLWSLCHPRLGSALRVKIPEGKHFPLCP